MICSACGQRFPDEQTGTQMEHKPARCRELMDKAVDQFIESLKRGLMQNGLPEEYAEAAIGRRPR
jgi:hypothetical protein